MQNVLPYFTVVMLVNHYSLSMYPLENYYILRRINNLLLVYLYSGTSILKGLRQISNLLRKIHPSFLTEIWFLSEIKSTKWIQIKLGYLWTHTHRCISYLLASIDSMHLHTINVHFVVFLYIFSLLYTSCESYNWSEEVIIWTWKWNACLWSST